MKKLISIIVAAGATLIVPQFAQAADLGGYEERETYVERPRVVERERVIVEKHHYYEPRYVERYVDEPEEYYRPRRAYYYAPYPRRHYWHDYRWYGHHAFYRDHRRW